MPAAKAFATQFRQEFKAASEIKRTPFLDVHLTSTIILDNLSERNAAAIDDRPPQLKNRLIGEDTEMTTAKGFHYVVLPYVGFSVRGPVGDSDHFSIGPYDLWRDTPENWQKYARIERRKILSMFVDRESRPLQELWIGTPMDGQSPPSGGWGDLVAALFYLCFVSSSSPTLPGHRARADDFYFEGYLRRDTGRVENDGGFVRVTKYGQNLVSDAKVFPGPDVRFRAHAIFLPDAFTIGSAVHIELFPKLAQELEKDGSRILRALGFFMAANYESSSRASFGEDIQNICTAFESLLLPETKKGDTARQVSDALTSRFHSTAPTATDARTKTPPQESQEVLAELKAWITALYQVRNQYTHGKPVNDYRYEGRSLWQDSFEIFRLAANRVILGSPESRMLVGATELEGFLMSEAYLARFIMFFKQSQVARQLIESPTGSELRKEATKCLDRAQRVDANRIRKIRSQPQLRRAFYGLFSLMYRSLAAMSSENEEGATPRRDYLQRMESWFENAHPTGKCDLGRYLEQAVSGPNPQPPGAWFEDTCLNGAIANLSKIYRKRKGL